MAARFFDAYLLCSPSRQPFAMLQAADLFPIRPCSSRAHSAYVWTCRFSPMDVPWRPVAFRLIWVTQLAKAPSGLVIVPAFGGERWFRGDVRDGRPFACKTDFRFYLCGGGARVGIASRFQAETRCDGLAVLLERLFSHCQTGGYWSSAPARTPPALADDCYRGFATQRGIMGLMATTMWRAYKTVLLLEKAGEEGKILCVL